TIGKTALTITAADKSKVYGDANPTLTGTITGIKNGDAITANYITSATAASIVGTYAIIPAAADSTPSTLGNYSVTLINGTLTVTKATLTVTADNKTKILDAVNPAFTATYSGFKNSDTFASAVNGAPSLTTTATTTSAVGNYPITSAAGTLVATNY